MPEARSTEVSVRSHRSFAVVLSGGGAPGLSHAGVLRGLEHLGYTPAAVVGLSMGAIVGTTYCLREDWYRTLRDLRLGPLAVPSTITTKMPSSWVRVLFAGRRLLADMLFGWGIGARAAPLEWKVLRALAQGRNLDQARVPVVVTATDLLSGQRILLRHGPAAEAMYASSAIAGIFPPRPWSGHLLVDGAYVDPVPVDVARDLGVQVVIVVEPVPRPGSESYKNGLEAMIRAMVICSTEHTAMRSREADLVLRPVVDASVDMLDFAHGRDCIAAGLRAVRTSMDELRSVLSP